MSHYEIIESITVKSIISTPIDQSISVTIISLENWKELLHN